MPALRPTCFHGGVQNPACVPFSVAPSVIAVPRRYRNVRLLRIGYAFRPRLSSRLTLGGLAFPRKPWAYGGGVSRAALVTHASILTPLRSTVGRPPASPRRGSSPTNVYTFRRFGASLSPVNCRRMSTRPVSCYALFECSYFGENEISPGLIGLSPLPTGHPLRFQPKWVRPSTGSYPRFSLPMGSSPGFASTTRD